MVIYEEKKDPWLITSNILAVNDLVPYSILTLAPLLHISTVGCHSQGMFHLVRHLYDVPFELSQKFPKLHPLAS